jgi:hypothetical protein
VSGIRSAAHGDAGVGAVIKTMGLGSHVHIDQWMM